MLDKFVIAESHIMTTYPATPSILPTPEVFSSMIITLSFT